VSAIAFLVGLSCTRDVPPPPVDDTGGSGPFETGLDTGDSGYVPKAVAIHVDAANVGDVLADGTAEHPFADFESAFEQVAFFAAQAPRPPVDVLVAEGTVYFAGGLLTASGSAQAPITIRGSDTSRPIIDGQGKLAAGLYLNGDHLVVEGLEVQNTKLAGFVLNGDDIVVRKNVIHEIGCCGHGTGIAFISKDPSRVLIEANTLWNTGEHGIDATALSDSVIRNNVLADIGAGSFIYDEGVFIELARATNVLVENNYLRDDQRAIHWGIRVREGERVTIRRNVVIDLESAAVALDGVNGVTLAQNTFANFAHRDRVTPLVRIDAVGDLTIVGNVLQQLDGPLVDIDAVPAKAYVDHNVYWSTAADWFVLPDGSRAPALSTWVAATGLDASSLSVDPLLGASHAAQPSDFAPDAKSPILDGFPGLAVAGDGKGVVLPLVRSGVFSDGIGLVAGDDILVGGQAASVVAVDVAARTVSLAKPLAYATGMPASFTFGGKAPDYGAVEAGIPTEVGSAAGVAAAF
jgi:hypothetical protein